MRKVLGVTRDTGSEHRGVWNGQRLKVSIVIAVKYETELGLVVSYPDGEPK